MEVYRYLSEYELKAWQEDRRDELGSYFYESEKTFSNNHRYKRNEKYLHFFKNITDIKYIKSIDECVYYEHFLCKFDIPLGILLLHSGNGEYFASIEEENVEKIREFAIPVRNIKTEYLQGFVSIKKLTKTELRGNLTQDCFLRMEQDNCLEK